ncbi:MAG: hypothetical protein Q4F11_04505 [Eubacteriales bacterium]|nr:hypothetical protein [Eubacteriales bacterium]
MIEKLRELNDALPEMLFIDIVYLILGELIICLAAPDNLKSVWAVGFLAGVIYSVFGTFQLSFRIRKVVYGGGNTTAVLLVGYMIRLGMLLAVLVTLYLTGWGDMLAALAGMFSMKVAAYSQPFTNKFLSKINKKGR